MDPITQQTALACAGASGGAAALYVDDVFSTFLYTGTGASKTITNGLDLSGEGGAVWLKARGAPVYRNHTIVDSERGVDTSGNYKVLYPNLTNGEYSPGSAANATVSSFNSDGFTLGNNANSNVSSQEYASWSFRKAPGFFDVVTYTGTGSAQTISHNLGSTPGMIVVKATSSGYNWPVYHVSTGEGQVGLWNSSSAFTADTTAWNNTAPTSSQFSVGASTLTNDASVHYVAYLFANDDQSFGTNSDEAIIKCGTFTANAGVNVDLGFEPQFIITKSANQAYDWYMFDVARGWHADRGSVDSFLEVSDHAGEFTSNNSCGLHSTGFTSFGSSGGTYIYVAIKRPHKPPTDATKVFKTINDVSYKDWDIGFPVDLNINSMSGQGYYYWNSRLSDGYTYYSSGGEVAGAQYFLWDHQNKFQITGFWAATTNLIAWHFGRAAHFFDHVVYSGTGSAQSITHNLDKTPELIIIRRRNATSNWSVYTTAIDGSLDYFNLNSTAAAANSSNSLPTSSVFNVSTDINENASGATYNSYLFSTLEGVSKVGTYTGTGNNVDVDCGFTAGARFVLIKRTDSTGYWYLWDTVRGIVSGNDPYLLLHNSQQAVLTTDYIDPLNSGFTVTSSAPAELNASGGTYLFFAIA